MGPNTNGTAMAMNRDKKLNLLLRSDLNEQWISRSIDKGHTTTQTPNLTETDCKALWS